MTKLQPEANPHEPVVIQINQGKSCDCRTEGKEGKPEAVPFPFKGETLTTCPVSVGDERKSVLSSGSSESSESESTVSVVAINSPPESASLVLPLLTPRDHSGRCVLEVSVLEKHAKGCSFKKRETEGRNPLDDQSGSYDVVSRMVYRTCAGNANLDDHGDAIKGSHKGFRLNDPALFGKDLKVKRSRIETLPILPNYDKCMIMRAQPQKDTNPFLRDDISNQPKTTVMVVDGQPVFPEEITSPPPNMEVLSVYIRKDKNEKVPDGFHKLHYRGDSCKLHDPNERTKQILALQNVISETASAAHIIHSNKRFSPPQSARVSDEVRSPVQLPKFTGTLSSPPQSRRVSAEEDLAKWASGLSPPPQNTRIMAAVGRPAELPKALYTPPAPNSESDESVESYRISKKPPSFEMDDDSIDLEPQRHISTRLPDDDGGSTAGLFGCFKRGKLRRHTDDSYTDARRDDSRGGRITHIDNQPRRNSSGPQGERRRSVEHSNRRNY